VFQTILREKFRGIVSYNIDLWGRDQRKRHPPNSKNKSKHKRKKMKNSVSIAKVRKKEAEAGKITPYQFSQKSS